MDAYDACISTYSHSSIVASMLWRRVVQGCLESGVTDTVLCARPCGRHIKIMYEFIDSYFFDGSLASIVGDITVRVGSRAAYFAGYDRERNAITVFPSFTRQYLQGKDILRIHVDGVAVTSVVEMYARIIAHEIIHSIMGRSMHYTADDLQDTTGWSHGPFFIRLNQRVYKSFPHRSFLENNYICGVRYKP